MKRAAPLNVLLLNQYYFPDEAATAQLLADLGSALSAAGHHVVAVTSNRSYGEPSRRYPAQETVDGVDIRRVGTSGFGRSNAIGRLADYGGFIVGVALRLLFGKRPDVIVALTTPPMIALVGSVIGRLRGARTIFWSMDVYPDIAYELGALRRVSVAGRVFAAVARATTRNPDLVVALGETMAARLRKHGAKRVEVIHNWSDEEGIQPRSVVDHPMRQKWGWGRDFVVMYSGNMGLAHEFGTVIEGAGRSGGSGRSRSDGAEHRNDHPPAVRFAFVGGGPRKEAVIAEVERRGLASVEFRGYVERSALGLSLTAPDVHLVTLRERMPGLLVPSKIYGILAAGKPTIYVGPAEGEVYEILKEGACGACVAIGDVDQFAAVVERYRREPARVAEEGRRARELFELKFSKRIAVERWLDLVQEVGLGGGRAGLRSAGRDSR